MRALVLVAGAALALAACGHKDQQANTTNVDENLTAESIVSNDVTAIDAVTGDAANMAADINYEDMSDNSVANLPANGTTTMPKVRQRTVPTRSENSAEPVTGNVSDNGAE